ncbi:GNAT family N-acetyltransferase [Microbispora siamensis]
MTVIGLRPATQADSEFCFRLHKAALGEYVAAIWGWDEQDQRGHHARVFDPGNTRIVTVDGADAGMLSVDYRPTEIYLGRIEIDPAYQGRGIGTHLITALLDEARRRGQDLLLDVLTVNHRAHALYRRLGFKDVARHGGGDIKIRMRHTPPPR